MLINHIGADIKVTLGVDSQLSGFGFFIRRANACEVGNLTGSRALVESLDIAPFANVERTLAIDFVEVSTRNFSHIIPVGAKWGDECC